MIAGVAYKRDIDDLRESPALDVMGLLHAKGARLSYIDPYIPSIEARSWPGKYAITSAPADTRAFGQYDCVVIVTDHRSFDYQAMVQSADLIVDTRNAIKTAAPNVFRLGAPRPEAVTAPAV